MNNAYKLASGQAATFTPRFVVGAFAKIVDPVKKTETQLTKGDYKLSAGQLISIDSSGKISKIILNGVILPEVFMTFGAPVLDPSDKELELKDGKLVIAKGGLKIGAVVLDYSNSENPIPLAAGSHELKNGIKIFIKDDEGGAGIIKEIDRTREKPVIPKPATKKFSFSETAKNRKEKAIETMVRCLRKL